MFFNFNDENKYVIDALNASMATIEFKPNGEIIKANSNFLQAVGYGLNEVAGKHHSMFCDQAYTLSSDYKQFWNELAAGRFQSNEFKRFGKDGRVIWLQASYNPIKDKSGKVVKVIKFAADITQSKMQNIDFTGKIAAIDRAQAVIEFTTKGEVITANENFLSTLGYRLDEIKGQHHRLFCESDYTKSNEYTQFWANLAKGEFQAAEYKRLGKGGKEVYIQASYNPIFDDTGTVVKIVKFATDVTADVKKRLHIRNMSLEIDAELGNVIEQMITANKMASNASGASSDTSSIINSVAAASEELSLSVREIGQSMESAKSGVESVFNHTRNANDAVTTLNNSATAMNNVVGLIQDIASQINLLALNATIESARAGEAGRGFAVVASEVKSLANQAAASTKNISDEISKMQGVTKDVVGAMSLISSSLDSVLENVASVAGAIEEQHAVTGEISNNMQTAVTAVEKIETGLSHITTTFSMVSTASEQVKLSVESLVA